NVCSTALWDVHACAVAEPVLVLAPSLRSGAAGEQSLEGADRRFEFLDVCGVERCWFAHKCAERFIDGAGEAEDRAEVLVARVLVEDAAERQRRDAGLPGNVGMLAAGAFDRRAQALADDVIHLRAPQS